MLSVSLEREFHRLLLTAARLGKRCRFLLKGLSEDKLPDFNWRETFDEYIKAMQACSRHAQAMTKTKQPELTDAQFQAELVAIGLDHVRTMAVPDLERVLRERGLAVIPLEGN